MKLFFKSCFFINLFIIGVQVQAQTYATLTSPEKLAAQAVWMLQNREGISGTSFFIAPNRMVTNFHVIEHVLKGDDKLTNIKILQETGHGQIESDIKITKIIALSAVFDLAILETDKSTNSYLKIRTKSDFQPENLISLGYPRQKLSKMSQTGPLQISNQLVFSIDHYQLGGASGSPVLDDENQVVGIVSSNVHNFMSSIRSDQLNRLIEGEIGVLCEDSNSTCMKETIKLIFKAANEGDMHVQYLLGLQYLDGRYHRIGIEKNIDKAIEWFLKAADQGLVDAQYLLGSMYFTGDVVEENGDKAIEWLLISADQGLAVAQYLLGSMYFTGDVVEKNKDKSIEWLLKAADQGLSVAQFQIASMYFYGNVVEKNKDKAFEWLLKAADQGYPPAQFQMGESYLYEVGLGVNRAKSLEWLLKATDQGYGPAQRLLGILLREIALQPTVKEK